MKKIFTLIGAFFITVATMAAINPSRLSIASAKNVNLLVVIDGQPYGRISNAITVDDLSAGNHNIKIYEARNGRRPSRNFSNDRLIYASTLFIKPRHHVKIYINRNGGVNIREESLGRNGWDDRDRDDRDRYDDRRNDNYRQPLGERTLNAAKDAIRREHFDRDKAELAKQIVADNALYTSQVEDIMSLFSFDDAKLDFAKFAYVRTIDRKNYFTLYDNFAFRTSKEALMNYVKAF